MTVNLRKRREGCGSNAGAGRSEKPHESNRDYSPGSGDGLDLRQLLASLDAEIAAGNAGDAGEAGNPDDSENSLASLIPPSSDVAMERAREYARRANDPDERGPFSEECRLESERSQAEGRKSMEKYFDDCIARGIRPKTHMEGVLKMFDDYVARKGGA